MAKTKTRAAHPRKNVRPLIDKILPDHLECRDMMHAWQPYDVVVEGKKFHQTVQCSRCTYQKTRTLSDTGKVLKKWGKPVYPEGYIIKGLGFLTKEERDEIRMRAMSRTIIGGL